MRRFPLSFLAISVAALPQSTLSLRDAAKAALEKHPSMEAALERVKVADQRIEAARSGWLPKVNYSESYFRSNNPVFVFSSLLTQHQFAEQNFAIGTLNRPDPLNNFQSIVSVDQTVWDQRQTRLQVHSAQLGKEFAGEDRRAMEMRLLAGVVRAYSSVLMAEAALRAAESAVRSADADLEKATAIRTAGLSTDADVLSIKVHLASVREHRIRRETDVRVARMALNEVLGLPLETDHQLTTPLAPASKSGSADLVSTALSKRPEIQQSKLAVQLAETQVKSSKASLWPQVSFRGVFETDRQQFVNKGGANWLIGASLRWNLFNGFADRARIREAEHSIVAARAMERQAHSGISLEVRRAEAELETARQRIAVAESAVEMAEESLRIMKNRYEAGLSTVTDLLRNETALLDAQTRRLMAIHDQRVAAAQLELAAGTLTGNSEVLD
jgi:outer membrane protein TolC